MKCFPPSLLFLYREQQYQQHAMQKSVFRYENNSILSKLFSSPFSLVPLTDFFLTAIWNKTFLLSSLSSSALSFMLMEIVCLSDRERERRQRKKDIGLTSIYFYVKLYTFYISLALPTMIRVAMLTSVFIVNTYWLWHNMEIVLPANYSIVASCALNLKDYLLSPQTQVAPHNRMDIKFYYHIGSTYRQHKI